MAGGQNASAFLALLDKISTDHAWHADAACLGADPEVFFPVKGGTVDAAIAICQGCPVREPCKEAGRDELYGVWGGTSVEDRRAERMGRTR